MSQEWRWLGWKGICIGLMLTLSGCAWLGEQQRLMIYRPTLSGSQSTTHLAPSLQHYRLGLRHPTRSEHLAFWWLPHPNAGAPTLLYLHGTFRNLEGNLHKIEALRNAGFSVLAVDYRGWGDSSPLTPSEASIVQDALVAWTELKNYQPNAKKRVIYGHSMGSGVAVDLASQLKSPDDYGGLVLESAFTSFTDVAHASGWLTSLINLFNRERFASIEKISRVQAPLLMLHGSQDDTIPIQLGERLFAAANPPKQWVRVEGAAHSDLDQVDPALYHASLQGFAASYLSGQ
ncbi:alpha/beta hydrolase [Rhodoferax sp.]|uniref:alpha/beta hydrolase n=1 Tax=Rhodoferax sp. TaxID=50421 RepID=UPI00271B8571|nr:alpha/beta fold hydrolase [Rhodoferax sp.]MDO8319405.1 alpha/beta fold hydrolase [Rhodoferax sp.]